MLWADPCQSTLRTPAAWALTWHQPLKWLHKRNVLTIGAEQRINDILTMKSRCCAIWPAAPDTATVRVGFSACFKSS